MQNKPIMSFRINKSNGFVLGLFGFVWLKKPLESQPRPLIGGVGGAEWREMEHRATALCSLQGRQECLSLPISELSGRSSRRMFMKLRGEASEGGVGIFYETKPTSLL